MNKIYTVLIIFIFANIFTSEAQIVTIPDTNFKASLLALGLDKNKNNEIEKGEAYSLIELNISNKGIQDLTGIEAFPQLFKLNCSHNDLTEINLSKNTYLTQLNLSNNKLSSIDLSELPILSTLQCSHNLLTDLNLSKNTSISTLDCSHNKLKTLYSSGLNFYILDCSNNEISGLDLTSSTNLNYLLCDTNQITGSIDLSVCADLMQLDCRSNKITALELGHTLKLAQLNCSYNNLRNLNVSSLSELVELDARGNILLDYICVKNQAQAKANPLFFKEEVSAWTENCTITSSKETSSSPQALISNNEDFFILTLPAASDVVISGVDGKALTHFVNIESAAFGHELKPGVYFVFINTQSRYTTIKILK